MVEGIVGLLFLILSLFQILLINFEFLVSILLQKSEFFVYS